MVSPRGMLEPWSLKQKWLKKRIARWLYQDRDLRLAAALHATAESEAEQFRRLGFVNEIVVSPNGVNVPDSLPQKGDAGGVRRVLFVSRMHPKKGVLELVESWARVKKAVEAKGGRWICELVYTVDGAEEAAYEQKVRRRVHELGLDGQFVFTGALDDKKKWEAYARADLFVLPTYSENFGIVVAEALWAGVPVITTKGAPWSELEGKDLRSNGRPAEQSGNFRCGWWIDLPPTDSLDAALREAMTTPDLRELGERGHRLVARRYTWPAVCDAMVRGYARIAEARGRTGGERGKGGGT